MRFVTGKCFCFGVVYALIGEKAWENFFRWRRRCRLKIYFEVDVLAVRNSFHDVLVCLQVNALLASQKPCFTFRLEFRNVLESVTSASLNNDVTGCTPSKRLINKPITSVL